MSSLLRPSLCRAAQRLGRALSPLARAAGGGRELPELRGVPDINMYISTFCLDFFSLLPIKVVELIA
jgi:hypothetical protein